MVGGFLKQLFGQSRPVQFTVGMAPLAPDIPFAAIGDVHGCQTLLDRMLEQLATERPGDPIILVGDYIDRGEDSAGVLARLHTATTAGRLICLMGNHEDMCLKFIDDPEAHGPQWLRNGGLQTLASFGVGGVGPSSRGPQLVQVRDALARRMGDGLIDWMRDLPLFWQSGNVVVVHAGADPALPMTDQKRASLLWGHKDFERQPRKDGLWVVHGHTIVPAPGTQSGRIATDTGAFATGRLSVAIVGQDDLRFVST